MRANIFRRITWKYAYLELMVLALMLGSINVNAQAEPQLKLMQQPVAGRITPEPISVEDYHGSLQAGYERLKFIAPGGELRWDAWTDSAYIETARAALSLINEQVVGNRECNDYFATMPEGKTFDQIWQATGAERVHVSFSPGPSGTWRAATYTYTAPYEWTITENTVRLGPVSVASAMVHEATRTNGVGAEWQLAYGAEAACGVRPFILNRAIMQQLGWRFWRDG